MKEVRKSRSFQQMVCYDIIGLCCNVLKVR